MEFANKAWKIVCCYITIEEQNELELKRQAKEAETEEFNVRFSFNYFY
jgi:hypothetical protein